MTTYELNSDHARQSGSGLPITETGPYVGHITSAVATLSKKGTAGIEMSFKSDAGGTAKYLSLWVKSAGGKDLFGLKTLSAIMACLKIKNMESVPSKIDIWKDGSKATVERDTFPCLCHKPIGLFLQKEEYIGGTGELKEKMALFAPFNAATKQTANEVLDQSAAINYDKIKRFLKDKLLPASQASQSYASKNAAPQAAAEPFFNVSPVQSKQATAVYHSPGFDIADGFDDDIAF